MQIRPVVHLLFRVAGITIRTEEGGAGGGDGEHPEGADAATNAERRVIMQETARLEQKEKLTITQQKRTFSNLDDSARSPYDVINEASRGDVPVQKKREAIS